MALDSPLDDALQCPSCGASNRPNALVCVSCGINMADFRAVLPRIRELRESSAAAHHQQLGKDNMAAIAEGAIVGRRQLLVQLRAALLVAGVLALFIAIGVTWYTRMLYIRQQRLAAQFETAQACLHDNDYLCARDQFEELLREEPDYPGAQYELNEARYRLAQQYRLAREWEAAIAELDAVLEDKPGDERALTLLHSVYDDWIEEARRNGNLWIVLQVMMQRSIHLASDG